MRVLTPKQKKVLDFIEEFITGHSYPPTIREIAESFAISVKGAYDHIKALERKNCIKLQENRSRSIEVVKKSRSAGELVEVPILGSVAAGRPISAVENYSGSIQLPLGMIKSENCFALQVRGDSMKDAGIFHGDIAIIEQRPVAENGEIVVAMIDDMVTLKRFYKENNRIKLVAENPAYSPIYTQEARILGRLRGLLRNY
jgi:repressor LexA